MALPIGATGNQDASIGQDRRGVADSRDEELSDMQATSRVDHEHVAYDIALRVATGE